MTKMAGCHDADYSRQSRTTVKSPFISFRRTLLHPLLNNIYMVDFCAYLRHLTPILFHLLADQALQCRERTLNQVINIFTD